MATRWGLCGAGKIGHDFSVAMKTFPPGDHQVLGPVHCPITFDVDGKETQFPLPEPSMPLNFTNSTGLRYETEEVRQCLLKGLTESPRMTHSDSTLMTEIMDKEVRPENK